MELRQGLKLRSVISASAGLALSTITYVASVELAVIVSGKLAWLAILTAGLVCLLASFCFAELGSLFPSAASIKLYIEKAFGSRAAYIISFCYMLITFSIIGAESYVLGRVLEYIWPGIPGLVGVIGLLVALTVINIRGLKLSSLIQDTITYVTFVVLVTGSLYALYYGHSVNSSSLPVAAEAVPVAESAGESVARFITAVAMGVFMYMGFEWVIPLAEEVSDYRIIPRGMWSALACLFVSYGLFNSAMTTTVGLPLLREMMAGETPIPHVLFGERLFGRPGLALPLFLSVVGYVSMFNAGLMSASRFLYALSRDRVLPKWFAKVHLKYATPWVAIVAMFSIALVVSLYVFWDTKAYRSLLYLGAFAECMIFAVTGYCLFVLRLKKVAPGAAVVKAPGGAVTALFVGVLFTFLMMAALSEQPSLVYFLAVVAGLVTLYVSFVIPRLKAQQKKSREVEPRRPRRPSKQNLEGESAAVAAATQSNASENPAEQGR